MNKFEFKVLKDKSKRTLKQKTLNKELRKEVNTGANGTQGYMIKQGSNKNKIIK